jgi:hypothetical protein
LADFVRSTGAALLAVNFLTVETNLAAEALCGLRLPTEAKR